MSFLDIQSWWEVPSIAYFCSLFRTAFNLLDFDIEELEEALLTDGTEESACSLLTELIVRLLNGCLGNNEISAFNYQMFLRRIFRRKCQSTGRYNPFNTDIDFQFLPLRTKVEILYALCDFRLDADDVFDLFKNLEAESLRVEPLGWDDNASAYWYFYGTRLYREDFIKKPKSKNKSKRRKSKDWKRRVGHGDVWIEEDDTERVWQVVCFTEADWAQLTNKFKKATSKVEKELYRSLSQNFLPEIPKLFLEKERLQRKRLLELAPRRTSNRVLEKIKQKEEDSKQSEPEIREEELDQKAKDYLGREDRARKREILRSQSPSSDSSEEPDPNAIMPQKSSIRKSKDKKSKNSSASHKGEPPPDVPMKPGRKTNNSLASATGQILIADDEPVNTTRKILKTSQIFSQSEEDIKTDMYKVLEQLTNHDDAWPFVDPVEEDYAPNYYAVIRRPMDLKTMEERLDSGHYRDFNMFKSDFKLIVNNCRLYNGQDNEYTQMVDNLQAAFDKLTEKYFDRGSSTDEEIAVEFPAPTMSRKHKVKGSESPVHHKSKRRKEDSDTEALEQKPSQNESITPERKKESRKDRGKSKKKHKTHHHHHHGKHSKSHKKYSSHKRSHEFKKSSKHSKKLKRLKEGKKSKSKHKKGKHTDKTVIEKTMKRSGSKESIISSRSRSASPLPSIHTPSPSPSPEPTSQISDSEFFKDKYDKIKERRRQTVKDNWDSLLEVKSRHLDKLKQNVSLSDKDKNQKLRETIEKLKAKNERYKDNALFNLLASKKKGAKLVDPPESVSSKGTEDIDFSDDSDSSKVKRGKKSPKVVVAKNESASEALEEAVKDISKWFDDAPASIPVKISPNNSPALTISTDEQDNSRLDDDFSNSEKNMPINKKELRKRPSSREPKIPIPPKRREIQRTIDRLQPGKSKGNLLTNTQTIPKVEEVVPVNTKLRDIKTVLCSKSDEDSPKLSLGSVLPEAGFTLGTDHNFEEEVEKPEIEEQTSEILPEIVEEIKAAIDKKEEKNVVKAAAEEQPQVVKQDIEQKKSPKANQEKATPNLSAWFKAFGAPKSTGPTKKKTDDLETDEKQIEATQPDVKTLSPKTNVKYDSPNDAISPLPEGGDSPSMNPTATPRQRRTSTGSSVSERSSFSQDLDSPRHQISHTSPLLRSPASPRTDDFQKITYPIINGSVRVGFYQDTASIRSSPEKSCSPRDGPQSPYSPYSPHVYAASTTSNNYFTDHNRSPLPNYGNTQPPFYDGMRTQTLPKGTKSNEDYVTIGSESYHAQSPYSQCDQQSPGNVQNLTQRNTQPLPNIPQVSDTKIVLFPAKKRHNEVEQIVSKKGSDGSISTSTVTPSIDDIAQALSEKSELAKLRSARERSSIEMMERNMQNIDRVENLNSFENVYDRTNDKDSMELENLSTGKIQPALMDKRKMESVDMINMGYLNIDDRRPSSEAPDAEAISLLRESNKTSNIPPKIYNMEGINMNLGIGVHSSLKQNPTLGSMHSKQIEENINRIPEKSMHEYNLQHNISDYNHSTGESHSIGNFTLNDLETAAKKLYSCVNSTSGQDYETWKLSANLRKPEHNGSGFPGSYISETTDHNKHKSNISIPNANLLSYNKSNSLHHQQNLNYNPNLQKSNTTQHTHSELRIPNPRTAMKNDMPETSSHENEARNIDNSTRMQKSEKLVQNHPLVSPLQFKTPYSSHSALPMETLRNIPNLPQMLERYSNEERYLSTFAGNSQLYHEKTLQMAQMFNKSLTPDTHPVSSSNIYSQSPIHVTKDTNPYKPTTNLQAAQIEVKNKNKRRATPKPVSSSNQGYHTSYASSTDSNVLSCAKPNVVPGSAFNFGPSTSISLGSGLYSDNSSFSLEDFRNSTANQFIAANYMAAAAAAHQRTNSDANVEKLVKPAHQSSSHSTAGSFPFMGHSQVRAGYPFVGSDASSPIYQQYFQRQEELLRQTSAQMIGLYPPGYPGSLGVRQPYDSMNRPSWL